MTPEIVKLKDALIKYIQEGNTVRFSTTCADGHWTIVAEPGEADPLITAEGYAEEALGPCPHFSDLRICDMLMLAASVVDPKSGY